MTFSSDRKITLLGILLFAGAFAWLCYLKTDTGVPWDEPWQQNLGIKSYEYATGQGDKLLVIQNRYHGGSVETALEGICRFMGVYTFNGRMQLRRTLLTVFFMFGALFLFATATRLTGRRVWGLVACAMLFFTPRIMVHAAINSKDLPLLSVAAFFLWCCLRFWQNPTWWRTILCGVAVGGMVSLRIPAVYVLFLWVFLWAGLLLKGEVSRKKLSLFLPLFIVCSGLFTYCFWPVLWGNPFAQFGNAWAFMSHFPWLNDLLFMGELTMSDKMPPYYIPVWMAVTIPAVWTLFFLLGLALCAVRFFKKWYETYFTVFLAAFVFAPIVAVAVMHSIVYDEWRHLFFVYPGFILVAVWAMHTLYEYFPGIKTRTVMGVLVLLQLTEVGWWCASNPHYTYLYFNPPARSYACGGFDHDYWGMSYKNGLAFLLTRYEHTPLKICFVHTPGIYNYWTLDNEDQQKLQIVPYDQAEYLVTNHRFEKEPFHFGEIVFEDKVDGCAIVTVYRR